MQIRRGLPLLRALVCLLCLVSPGLHAAPASPYAVASIATLHAQEKEESCGRGKATKDFGWKVVSFGVTTLKYLIGLFIIPIGFFLVIIGAVLQMVEALVC
ncbi:hypothetical protein [Methylopila sp. M107]|uniref:hypothetical protein n=1 Tax=Methylopila sp. M107 TaxID=1101190 RepID=UPI00036A588C|nr:hypothetical protein [Methylopila sp. M107]